jgi:hypothetical protein
VEVVEAASQLLGGPEEDGSTNSSVNGSVSITTAIHPFQCCPLIQMAKTPPKKTDRTWQNVGSISLNASWYVLAPLLIPCLLHTLTAAVFVRGPVLWSMLTLSLVA